MKENKLAKGRDNYIMTINFNLSIMFESALRVLSVPVSFMFINRSKVRLAILSTIYLSNHRVVSPSA